MTVSRLVPKFICPYCGHETVSRVLETRDAKRRRECEDCASTFTTIERIDPNFQPARHKPRVRRLPLFDLSA
jgi:transcriptional regulator NrdR family protein